MELELKIPTLMSEVTLKRYQDFQDLIKKSNDEEFVMHKTLEIFCDIQLRDAFKIRATDVVEIVEKLARIFEQKAEFQSTFKIGDVEFGFIPKLEDMSWGEYMDLEKYIGSWDTYHRAMAVMYRPITRKKGDMYEIAEYNGTELYAEVMRFAPLDVVQSSSVFFYNLGTELHRAFLAYMQRNLESIKTNSILAQKLNSINNGVGTTLSTDLLRETLQSSMRLPQSMSIRHSLSLVTKSRKTKSMPTESDAKTKETQEI
jgi:hypothetical protein